MFSGATRCLVAKQHDSKLSASLARSCSGGLCARRAKDEGASWVEALYLLRVSAVDGKDYEVRYQKK